VFITSSVENLVGQTSAVCLCIIVKPFIYASEKLLCRETLSAQPCQGVLSARVNSSLRRAGANFIFK